MAQRVVALSSSTRLHSKNGIFRPPVKAVLVPDDGSSYRKDLAASRRKREVVRRLQIGQRITLTKNCVNCLFFTRTVDRSIPHEGQGLRLIFWFSVSIGVPQQLTQ
jgi:hypothetical protein